MRAFKVVFFGGVILTFILGFVFPNPHPHFWWQYVCLLLVFSPFLV